MSALKKTIQYPMTPQKEDQPAQHKAEIERMKKAISEKIKDPTLAKKAALIISDMIQKK